MFPKFKIQVKGKGEDGIMWENIYKDGELIEENDNPIDDFDECDYEGLPDIGRTESDEEEQEEKDDDGYDEEKKVKIDENEKKIKSMQ